MMDKKLTVCISPSIHERLQSVIAGMQTHPRWAHRRMTMAELVREAVGMALAEWEEEIGDDA